MTSSAEPGLASLYQQFVETCPLRSAEIAGVHWAWADSCAGEQTLVILPGFMGEAETSFLYVLALRDKFRVVSLTYPATIGLVDALCDGVAALFDSLGIAQATILGGSTSGFLAQAFVRRHPERTRALILTHTGLPDPRRALTARRYLALLHVLPFGLLQPLMRLAIRAYFPHPTPTHVFWREHFRQVIRHQSRAAISNRFALMDDFHTHARFEVSDLAGWPGAVLIMEMRLDHLTTPAEQAALRALYPGAQVHVFQDTAHYDSVEDPDEQIRVIREFMSSLGAIADD